MLALLFFFDSMYRLSLKAFLVLFPLLGMPSILAIFVEYSVALQYIYTCIFGLSVSISYNAVDQSIIYLILSLCGIPRFSDS